MTKVQILTRCENCNGELYLPAGEAEDSNGGKYLRFAPCLQCEGSGRQTKWVSLEEFAKLLEQTTCTHQHTHYRGGFHFGGGDVRDDIQEVCTDCGANLDS